jgi:hypothetical protein
MSVHDHTDLGEEEEARLASLSQRILEALQDGPKTNAYLNAAISIDHCRRIHDLRMMNYHIRHDRLEGGLFLFTLLDKPDPEWEVDIELRAPDGQRLTYTVVVNADTAGKARNSAGRKGVRTKVLDARMVNPDAPLPPPLLRSNRATADLRAENEALRRALRVVYERWQNQNAREGRQKSSESPVK